jgi:hypothetical protein
VEPTFVIILLVVLSFSLGVFCPYRSFILLSLSIVTIVTMRNILVWALAFVATTTAQRISTSARCGAQFGLTCQGSTFGNCCSQYNYCGFTAAYCGTGCQSKFGTCSKQPGTTQASSSTSAGFLSTSTRSSSTVASPALTLKVSSNARCGNAHGASPSGMTCLGSKYGDCCSQYSYWCVSHPELETKLTVV